MSGRNRDNHAGGGSWLAALLDWPMLWGLGAAWGFYGALPHLPIPQDFATRYFCGHPVEYVSTVLFCMGIALLVRKAIGGIRERRALAHVVRAASAREEHECRAIDLLESLPERWSSTAIAERLSDASGHLESGSATGLGDHLKYLAELASERLYASYALVRTISWAIPILGFLGTVMGITIAIANINPEQLANSLSSVTGGLAVAFDTTALALAQSLVLVFVTFMVEGSERSLLDRIEAFALRRLSRGEVIESPLAQAEARLAGDLVERTDQMIRSQTEVWQTALETMRARWSETIIEQQQHLRDSLTTGMRMTLQDHEESLKTSRQEFVGAVSRCTDRLEEALRFTNDERARQLEKFSGDLRGLWDRCRGDLDEMQHRYADSLSETVSSVGRELAAFRDELHETNSMATRQHQELSRQGDQLVRIAELSGDLGQIEHRLNENLDSLRAAETMQEAVHSLTAAAHLLTARSSYRSRAAA